MTAKKTPSCLKYVIALSFFVTKPFAMEEDPGIRLTISETHLVEKIQDLSKIQSSQVEGLLNSRMEKGDLRELSSLLDKILGDVPDKPSNESATKGEFSNEFKKAAEKEFENLKDKEGLLSLDDFIKNICHKMKNISSKDKNNVEITLKKIFEKTLDAENKKRSSVDLQAFYNLFLKSKLYIYLYNVYSKIQNKIEFFVDENLNNLKIQLKMKDEYKEHLKKKVQEYVEDHAKNHIDFYELIEICTTEKLNEIRGFEDIFENYPY